jgi:hypothetical protein
MDKKKILETVVEVVLNIVMFGVGALLIATTGTFLYQMIRAMFD